MIVMGISAKYARPMNSFISEMPGPDVVVNARAPFQPAPTTMPADAISSSACTIAHLLTPVFRIAAIFHAVFRERFGERRGGRVRIPPAARRATVDTTQRRSGIA